MAKIYSFSPSPFPTADLTESIGGHENLHRSLTSMCWFYALYSVLFGSINFLLSPNREFLFCYLFLFINYCCYWCCYYYYCCIWFDDRNISFEAAAGTDMKVLNLHIYVFFMYLVIGSFRCNFIIFHITLCLSFRSVTNLFNIRQISCHPV
jgi:hypothetical protein